MNWFFEKYDSKAEVSKGTELLIQKMILITLVNIDSDEQIIIDKAPFVIGRILGDYNIEQKYISKKHAMIIQEDRYYIEDLDSANGTYLNGKKLACEGKELIRDGDMIIFAKFKYLVVEKMVEA